ncbi:anthocyanidin 3-O-glucosyltransferase 2 [Beta vulgaris subsp. vulgaris]|uniref:anthocyanidin 3-O-glucosyltransferase 2 n=1 Tax=Beta vulgaris subsp. vulgaris TaxID=3555 RepID=UPI002036F644|nr:anthocyanidin 3-O-glucosyltransferase 2 [Beta vulgaris subsp. vulgaris]
MKSNPAEVVLIPTPGMGHLLSAVELAKLIIRHEQRISFLILILNVPLNFSIVNNYINSVSRNNPYPTRLTFVVLPPLSHLPDPTSPNFLTSFIDLHKPLVKQIIKNRAEAEARPVGFIFDMLCTPMMDIATEFNIPWYIFFPSGASFLNLMLQFQSLADFHGIDIATEFSNPDITFDIPGFTNQVTGKIVPRIFLEKEGGSSMMIDRARHFRRSNGILVNSYVELQQFGIQALFDQVTKHSIPAVFPVGPIIELDDESRSGSQSQKNNEESIIGWLDEQPLSSVVFLCFGSMGSFDRDQVNEIAKGLENSGHRFLWSLRKPPPGDGKYGLPSEDETFVDALPEGFLDRTSSRGSIIGWAPQVSILAHSAIGGFVSHCGWNSILESLWFGVPIATWPCYAEQQLNAFELVKELELAVGIRIDYKYEWKIKKGNFLVTAKEIEIGVKKLMNLDETTKTRVKQMRDEGRKALHNGGSSHKWLRCFIEHVLSHDN